MYRMAIFCEIKTPIANLTGPKAIFSNFKHL